MSISSLPQESKTTTLKSKVLKKLLKTRISLLEQSTTTITLKNSMNLFKISVVEKLFSLNLTCQSSVQVLLKRSSI